MTLDGFPDWVLVEASMIGGFQDIRDHTGKCDVCSGWRRRERPVNEYCPIGAAAAILYHGVERDSILIDWTGVEQP